MAGQTDKNETQKTAQGHGLTSEEAREAGLDKGNLQPGKDFVVEHGREIGGEGHSRSEDIGGPAATQTISDAVNDDDISQREGSREKI